SATVSASRTGVTRAAMMPTASSTDIIGPPKAKQSSDSCAILISAFADAARQQVFNRYRELPHHSGDCRNVIDMGDRQQRLDRRISCNARYRGIVRKQQRLAIGLPMHLYFSMRLRLEGLHHQKIDRRQLAEQVRKPRLGCPPQLMHQRPAL